MAINKVILLGNLGHDVSFREFENGQVAQFSLATTEKGYKTKDGNKGKTDTHYNRKTGTDFPKRIQLNHRTEPGRKSTARPPDTAGCCTPAGYPVSGDSRSDP